MGKYLDTGLGVGTSGQPQGSLEQNTYSERLQHLNQLPSNDAQLKHIFADRPGHLADTPYNRHLVAGVANDPANYIGNDKYGNSWYAKTMPDGSQIWAKVYENKISDAGKNLSPRRWDNETGFANNPKRNNTWRRKK